MSSPNHAKLFAALSLDDTTPKVTRMVNNNAIEFLLPEMVNTLVATTLDARRISERIELGLGLGEETEAASTDGMDTGWQELSEDNEMMEQVYVKLETVGFRVGKRLAERFAPTDRRLSEMLDIVKFICKEIWMLLFNRQVDNLKTNHKGIYVLQDNKFKWFLRMSGNNGGAAAAQRAQPYIWLPCGIIRGILGSFGVRSVVVAETLGLPQCTFQIKVVTDGR